jgi:uncharacterized membrane protein (UPF0127 family)
MHQLEWTPAGASLRVKVAACFWLRLRGLLFRPPLAADEGLLILPCSSVHTIGMRQPIDVVFLSADATVLKVAESLRPMRTAACRGARAVLELQAGRARALGLVAGANAGGALPF